MFGTECPLGEGGELDAEEGVGVLDRLRPRARKTLFEYGSARCPVEAADDAHEDGQRALVVAVSVCLERRSGLLEERFAAGQREQRQLQQDQRVHGLGMVECQLGSDRRAAGVAGDVGARNSEMVQERCGVGGVVRDAHWRRGVGAADPAPLVVSDQLVVVGQRRF